MTIDERKLYQLASLVGCEPEDEQRHRENLLTHINNLITEARIEELEKLWSDDTIYWVESGQSIDFEESITLSDRIATLKEELK